VNERKAGKDQSMDKAVTAEGTLAPAWTAATARVRAYLTAAGLEAEAAADLAREIVAGCAAERPTAAEDEAVLASLRIARRLLIDQPAGEDGAAAADDALAPRDQPLSIRRRAFRSVMDWRLATSRIRRLLPARAPQRVRRLAGNRAQQPAPLTSRARHRRAMFFLLIAATTIWGVASFAEILAVDG
jgi:hypothetical protein